MFTFVSCRNKGKASVEALLKNDGER